MIVHTTHKVKGTQIDFSSFQYLKPEFKKLYLTLSNLPCRTNKSYDSEKIIDIPVDTIPELLNDFIKVVISPNPFNGEFKIHIAIDEPQDIELEIFTVNGNRIYKKTIFTNDGIITLNKFYK
jgi:hypothetical protein